MSVSEAFKAKAMEFWHQFNNETLAEMTSQINRLYHELRFLLPNPNPGPDGPDDIPNFDWLKNKLFQYFRNNRASYEAILHDELFIYEKPLIELANYQQGVMGHYFKDLNDIQTAFELFGQGTLFDKTIGYVHKMDGDGPLNYVGYPRWHAFIRCVSLYNVDKNFWLNVDRIVLLAYLIQSRLNPDPLNPENPSIDESTLNQFRAGTLPLTFTQIDGAFSSRFA